MLLLGRRPRLPVRRPSGVVQLGRLGVVDVHPVGRARAKGSLDEAQVAGRTVHMWTPGGMGRSQLAVELARGGEQRAAASRGTARNWATVTALAGLLDA